MEGWRKSNGEREGGRKIGMEEGGREGGTIEVGMEEGGSEGQKR